METRSEGEHETQPEVPARQRRNPDRQPRRTRVVGSDQRRQRRRLRTGAEARARPELRPRPQAPARIRRIVAALPASRQGRAPKNPDRPVAERWAERKAVWPNSPTWRYLARKRWLPSAIIEAASAAGVLREGPAGSAWFAHLDGHGVVAHVDVRGPTYKGSLTGGAKSLFRLPPKGPPLPRLVLAEAAIDALSVAAIESLRRDTLYAATGGGMGPGTIAALEALLASIATLPARFSAALRTPMDRATASQTATDRLRKNSDPIRAASPSNRGRRLERRPSRPIRNEGATA